MKIFFSKKSKNELALKNNLMTENSKTEGHLVIERSQHKKINREIYTCVSILLFAGSPNHAGQAWYGIQLYKTITYYIYYMYVFFFYNYVCVNVPSVLMFAMIPPLN